MFRVLTVAREFGAGGSIIARRVAGILGWNLLDHTLIDAVACAAQVDAETVTRYDEHVDPWWRRFHGRGLWAAAIAAGIAPADAQIFDAETIAAFARRVIARAADAGNCVIVGRGAQCVLRGREDVFHVFIYGGWRERCRRVRGRMEVVPNIGEYIRQTDDERASYIRTYYGCDWKDPHLYHMMVSSEIGVENAVCRIVDAVERSCRV
jgi:cytidylate kinase